MGVILGLAEGCCWFLFCFLFARDCPLVNAFHVLSQLGQIIPQLCTKQRAHSWAATSYAKWRSSILIWTWQLAKLRKERSSRRFSLYWLNLHLCYFLFKKIQESFLEKHFSVLFVPSPVRNCCFKV